MGQIVKVFCDRCEQDGPVKSVEVVIDGFAEPESMPARELCAECVIKVGEFLLGKELVDEAKPKRGPSRLEDVFTYVKRADGGVVTAENAAAALPDLTHEQASGYLARLAQAGRIERAGKGRYQARAASTTAESPGDRA